MTEQSVNDRWAAGDAYEAYMGRWSRELATEFVGWLAAEPKAHWLDVGCGTGALASALCRLADPASVVACDPSEAFIAHAREHVADSRVSFVVAGAGALPARPGGFDAAVAGLVLNFLPDPLDSIAGMRERVRPGGHVAVYVWDYAGKMEFLRCFWDTVIRLDPSAARLDEGARFPICRPDALEAVFREAELRGIESRAVEIPTCFESFADFWAPLLGGTGPAPAYVASLGPDPRERLRSELERRLEPAADERIHLVARAWGVRGRV